MKILKLDLTAVGPFTGQSLDLSAGNHGLHVILGQNEAGKSSSLRALRAMFYGFPAQTTDNFLHTDYRSLRVGATLRHSDNTQVSFVRRKGNRDTLLDPHDKPLPDNVLAPFLGRVDEQQFTSFFGIGYEDLRAGSKQIFDAGGKLGESLFSASAGGFRLRTRLKEIQERLEELYTERGRSKLIPAALAKYREKMDFLKNSIVTVDEWSKHDASLSTARNKADEVKLQLNALTAEQKRLESFKDAIPLLAKRRTLLAELAAMGDVPALPADFSLSRQATETSLRNADKSAADLAEQIGQIDLQLVHVVIPQGLLPQAEGIVALQGQLGIHIKARQQVPVLTVQRDALRQDAIQILTEIRPGLSLDDVGQLRIPTARRQQVQSLSDEVKALRQAQKQGEKTLGELQDDKRKAQAALEALPAPRDPAALAATLSAVQQWGNLEKQLADETAKYEKLTRQAQADLKTLGYWTGELADVETLAVPSDESIEQARGRMEKVAAEADVARSDLQKVETELGGIDRKIAKLLACGQIPTEADLLAARAHRQKGWALVRDAWLGTGQLNAEVSAYSGGSKLDAAYERSVAHSDEIVDRLRTESDRVVSQANLVADRIEKEVVKQRAEKRIVEADQAHADAQRDWHALWQPLEITPRSPREMAAWARRQRELAQQVRIIREHSDAVDRLKNQIGQNRQLMADALVSVNEPVSETALLSVLTARAVDVLGELRRDASRRQALLDDVLRSDQKLENLVREKSNAESELEGWRQRWAAAIAGLPVPDNAEPVIVLAMIERIAALFIKVDELKKLSADLAAGEAQIQSIGQQARELLDSVAPDLKGTGTEQAIGLLNERLVKARADEARLKEMYKERQTAERNLKLARNQAQSDRESLAGLCRTARCETADQLPAVEVRHSAWKQLRADLRHVEEQLLLLANGQDLEQFSDQATGVNPDELNAQLQEMPAKIANMDQQHSALNQTIGTESEVLRKWDGNGAAGEAAEMAQQLLAELRDSAGEYVRLKLAHAVLQSGIQRYRQRKQGPLLTRASQLFSELTLGAFTALRADYNDADQPILLGVRAGGEKIEVEAMSDGTRDQLYLSLRLATLEDYLSVGEPIPFIVDDILVHFDNQRAAATLKVLAELSHHTQVILFTHHAHIADLAVGLGDDVHVHGLNPRLASGRKEN